MLRVGYPAVRFVVPLLVFLAWVMIALGGWTIYDGFTPPVLPVPPSNAKAGPDAKVQSDAFKSLLGDTTTATRPSLLSEKELARAKWMIGLVTGGVPIIFALVILVLCDLARAVTNTATDTASLHRNRISEASALHATAEAERIDPRQPIRDVVAHTYQSVDRVSDAQGVGQKRLYEQGEFGVDLAKAEKTLDEDAKSEQ